MNESNIKNKHSDDNYDDNSGYNNNDNDDNNNNGLNPTSLPTYAPPRVSFPPCNFCGNRRSVNLPGVIVRLEGFSMVECGKLGRDGSNRLSLSSECSLIPDQISIVCGCNPPCNVYWNRRPAGNQNAIIKFPGEPAMGCGNLQPGGLAGNIRPSECIVIPSFIGETYGCKPEPVDDEDNNDDGYDNFGNNDDDDNSGNNARW